MGKEIQSENSTEDGLFTRFRQFSSSGAAHQALIVTAVLLYGATLGSSLGYSAVLLPQLQSNSSSIPTDEDTGSWIASLQSGVSPLGNVAGGIAMDKWGRRFAMRVGLLPLFIGYLVLSFAPSHLIVLIGRFITGIAAGFSASASPIILCEISTPRLRGLLASSIYTTFSAGILLVYILGSYIHWRIVAGIISILPFFSFIIFLFVPETPVWLAKTGHVKEAEIALQWLRGNEKKAQLELKELMSTIRTEEELGDMLDDDEEEGKQKVNILQQISFLFSPPILKPFLIAHVICLFQILSGTILIIFYAVDLISETNHDGEGFNNYIIAQLTAFVRLVFVLVTNSLFYYIHRRTHASIAGAICAVSALVLGCFLYLQSMDKFSFSPTANTWITATFILLFIAANTCAFLPLPTTIMSELLPVKIRGWASGYIFAINDITQFLIAKSYPWLKETLGAHGVFVLFGINALISTLFCYFFLPETRGKSLAQIEEYFRGRNVFWTKRDRRLGRDYTRKRYFEMKKIRTEETDVTYTEPVQGPPEEVTERPRRNKGNYTVTFS